MKRFLVLTLLICGSRWARAADDCKPPTSNAAQGTAEDEAISEAMGTYWTHFAKPGDPNGAGIPQWPAFSDAAPVLMYFSGSPHAGPVPSEEGLKTLDVYFAWRRTPEGEAAFK